MNRREFVSVSSLAIGAVASGCITEPAPEKPAFKISLAEWSYHRALQKGEMKHLDFPQVARREHGIGAVELVNQFFMKEASDQTHLAEFKRRADGEGVVIPLIMCDNEGDLGDLNPAKRRQAASNHYKWADAAKFYGCHSIRVNAGTGPEGSPAERQDRAAEGLRQLTEYCASLGLNCIVENHGALASNGQWLVGLMKKVAHPRVGLLPDFGNWSEYDRYQGVREMMPYARAVSAKSHDFDSAGNCVETDYARMMPIVLQAGYHNWIGIEYEGEKRPEKEGVNLTKALLERFRFPARQDHG